MEDVTRSIAVAGKGGTGKTTIAALVVLHLVRKGLGPVLAIDADPDANLGALLGLEVEQSIGDLREEVLEEIKNFPAGMSKADYIEEGLHQIVEEAEGFDLLTMGRGEGSGCYCYLNLLVRKFSEGLFPSYQWVVMDNEAGLEHISRRTTSNIDALWVVVNDNPISINTAKRIITLSTELKSKIKQVFTITNGVKPERREKLQSMVEELDAEYIGDVPYDERLEEAVFNGVPLAEIDGSTAKETVSNILQRTGGLHGNT